MKVCLLYEDVERDNREKYYDTASIIKDLGLRSIFDAASKKLIYGRDGHLVKADDPDQYLQETLKAVMMTPLYTWEEISFRQEMIKDCLEHEDLTRSLYEVSRDMLKRWSELGRVPSETFQQGNPAAKLLNEILVLELFMNSLSRVKELLTEADDLKAKGFITLKKEFLEKYSEDREQYVKSVLEDIAFYTESVSDGEEERKTVTKPRIVLECGLEDGLKFSSMKLEEISSEKSKYYKPGSTIALFKDIVEARTPDSFSAVNDIRVAEQTKILEVTVVSYLADELKGFMEEFSTFFDRLKYQMGFYLASVQLVRQLERFELEWCYPTVCDRNDLEFEELKECVMGMGIQTRIVGNTCSFEKKDLLIVTGANQGGKSTFLRSIGIAQVMLQCGLPVTARAFSSGLFPKIFVHFTRREDSEMNSGRLDEELGRMSKIVDEIGDDSLILLNESFATTTEKEGSVIAYDIIKALSEAGVRILTVTHLLSFARRIYEESKENEDIAIEFLTAERLDDGTRTFRMIRHEPELTSFGLDLYEEIVGNHSA
jgi:DNA mismatch repair ATPase MutS